MIDPLACMDQANLDFLETQGKSLKVYWIDSGLWLILDKKAIQGAKEDISLELELKFHYHY